MQGSCIRASVESPSLGQLLRLPLLLVSLCSSTAQDLPAESLSPGVNICAAKDQPSRSPQDQPVKKRTQLPHLQSAREFDASLQEFCLALGLFILQVNACL